MRYWILLLLPLGALACSSAAAIEEGDRYFRLGDYSRAYWAYEEAWASGDRSIEVEERLAEARYRVVADHARKRLQREEPRQALASLDHADRLRPGHPWTSELRGRARRQLSAELTEEADYHLREENADQALLLFTRAVLADPENEAARVGQAQAQAMVEARRARGERMFLKGVGEEEAGNDFRAYTAFSAAEDLWGEGSRATKHLREITRSLAEESREAGMAFLEAGETGQAWLALRDASRLLPEDDDLRRLADEAEQQLLAEAELERAEHSARSLDFEMAEEHLQSARERLSDAERDQVRMVEGALLAAQNQERYTMARALERDEQIVRAMGLYQAILDSGAPDLSDVQIRQNRLITRLARAEEAYDAGIEALQRGDDEAAKRYFDRVLREARDFKDAERQLRRLAEE